MNELLSLDQAARLVGCSTTTIRRWMYDGRLTPAGHAGRSPRFHEHDLYDLDRANISRREKGRLDRARRAFREACPAA